MSKRFFLGLCAAALIATPALSMEAVQKVEREIVTTAPDGTQTVTYQAAERVRPGETVVYTLDYVNTQADPASDLKLDMVVPEQVRLAEGSADVPGARVQYSADGGQSYADRLGLTVRNDDGTTRAATTDDITHVRWTLLSPVQPGERGAVSFRAQLR